MQPLRTGDAALAASEQRPLAQAGQRRAVAAAVKYLLNFLSVAHGELALHTPAKLAGQLAVRSTWRG